MGASSSQDQNSLKFDGRRIDDKYVNFKQQFIFCTINKSHFQIFFKF